MRRLIVEVVLDALILFVALLVFSFITIPVPFPFGTGRSPIFIRESPGVVGYLFAGLDRRPREPPRPPDPRGPDRPARPLDPRAIPHRRERHHALDRLDLHPRPRRIHRVPRSCGSWWRRRSSLSSRRSPTSSSGSTSRWSTPRAERTRSGGSSTLSRRPVGTGSSRTSGSSRSTKRCIATGSTSPSSGPR